jgi:hypothetical protein
MTKAISTDQTADNISAVVDLLARTGPELRRLSKGMTPAQSTKALGKGERSFTECLAHILNCESRTSEVIILALAAKEPSFTPIHPERGVGPLLRYEDLPFARLLDYFELRREVLLKLLRSLKPAQWSRTVREEGKQRRESVYWQARGQALHELEHLEDLQGKLERR